MIKESGIGAGVGLAAGTVYGYGEGAKLIASASEHGTLESLGGAESLMEQVVSLYAMAGGVAGLAAGFFTWLFFTRHKA